MPKVTGGPASGEGVQAVVLALNILNFLAEQRAPSGVTELALALGTTKSRVYRHLQTLVQHGFVVQSDGSDRYQIGAALVRLGRMVDEHFDLAAIAHPFLRELRDQLEFSTVMARIEFQGVRVLSCLPVKSGIGVEVKPGTLLSFHSSAQGKIALAFGDEELLRRVLRSRLTMETPNTIVEPAILERDIAQVRERGWAVAPNEALFGVNVLAAPVFDASGLLAGTIGIVGSVQFLPAVPSEQQIRLTTVAARRISDALGARPNPPAKI